VIGDSLARRATSTIRSCHPGNRTRLLGFGSCVRSVTGISRMVHNSTSRAVPVMVLAGTWIVLNLVVLVLLVSPPAASRWIAYQPSYQVLRQFCEVNSASVGSEGLPYRLMHPSDESVSAPLVVFLHGAGERGTDNRQQLKRLPTQMASRLSRQRFSCYLLAPQCPLQSSWRNEIEELTQLIERVIREHSVDHSRVYLTGLSMGGFGAWHLAAHRPGLFAAVVPICGGGDPKTADRLAGLSIWAIHGRDDTVVPAHHSREMVQAVREAGGGPQFTELEGIGHNCWDLAYGRSIGVVPWMFEQRRVESHGGNVVTVP
jgi:predicted peptidase